jgi:hypothetical protein
MKTKNINLLKPVSKIILMAALMIIVACQSKEESQKDTTEDSKVTVAAPQVDLHTAVLTDNMDAVKQHIAAKSNLNEKDPFGGSSPLITASLFNKPEMAKVLLAAGADVNFQNNDGSTALHTAAFFCRPEIVKLLLENKADKTITNKFGATAYATVTAPYAEVKNTYEMMEKVLAPMGLKLDYAYIEKTRPVIAEMLK